VSRQNIKWLTLCALLSLGLLAGTTYARAQSPESATGGEGGFTVGAGISALHLQYGEHWLLGANASADAYVGWHYGVEGEANWARWRQQSDTWATTYLVGTRYQFNGIGDYRYRPYAKFLIGVGEFNFPYNYAFGRYFVMAPGAGVDYRLNSRVRLRLFDVEYQYWPGFTYGSMSNFGVSTGIRYRIR